MNITNSGVNGQDPGGTFCVNVYAFNPQEDLVSCCSCRVTPNALVSLSARNDLISNTLTPAVPTSIVIKLLATKPAGGSCSNSAITVTTDPIVPGMLAWGTTSRQQTSTTTTTTPNMSSTCQSRCPGGVPVYSYYTSYCQTYCKPITTTSTTTSNAVSETPFSPATLSAGELSTLGTLCKFIVDNGDGYGICRSCRLGAQVAPQ